MRMWHELVDWPENEANCCRMPRTDVGGDGPDGNERALKWRLRKSGQVAPHLYSKNIHTPHRFRSCCNNLDFYDSCWDDASVNPESCSKGCSLCGRQLRTECRTFASKWQSRQWMLLKWCARRYRSCWIHFFPARDIIHWACSPAGQESGQAKQFKGPTASAHSQSED